MKKALFVALAGLSCACASGPRPGPTDDGVAVKVSAREKAAARREAVEKALPLFLDDRVRVEKAAIVEGVLSKADAFTGKERLPKKGDGAVEVRVDPLAAALDKAGLIRPTGYPSGPDLILIAFGDRASAPGALDRLAAEDFETALFGRGLQAQDADDPLVQLKNPLKAKTEEALVAEAAAGGWPRLATGRVEGTAAPEPTASAWRAKAKLTIALYAGTSAPERVVADGEALDVSSFSAISHALDQAAQAAAARVDRAIVRSRGGRATLAVLVSGYKDPTLLRRVIDDLRRAMGVQAAALVSWHGLDDMAVIRVYASDLRADVLAARLLHGDTTLRLDAIETEDGRLTVAGPEVPESADRGRE